jgi:hypothetical protein
MAMTTLCQQVFRPYRPKNKAVIVLVLVVPTSLIGQTKSYVGQAVLVLENFGSAQSTPHRNRGKTANFEHENESEGDFQSPGQTPSPFAIHPDTVHTEVVIENNKISVLRRSD